MTFLYFWEEFWWIFRCTCLHHNIPSTCPRQPGPLYIHTKYLVRMKKFCFCFFIEMKVKFHMKKKILSNFFLVHSATLNHFYYKQNVIKMTIKMFIKIMTYLNMRPSVRPSHCYGILIKWPVNLVKGQNKRDCLRNEINGVKLVWWANKNIFLQYMNLTTYEELMKMFHKA